MGTGSNPGNSGGPNIDLNILVPVVVGVVVVILVVAGTLFIRRQKRKGEKIPAYT